MLKQTTNRKPTLLAVALMMSSLFWSVTFGQNRNQGNPQPGSGEKAAKEQAVDEKEKRAQERIKTAQRILQDILTDSNPTFNPVVKIRIRMLVGDAYWSFEPEKARKILSEEFPKIALISVPESESEFGATWSRKSGQTPEQYKGQALEQVKAQLRRDLLASITAHDPDLAKGLLVRERSSRNDESSEDTADEILASARDLAEVDPEASERIIKDSLKTGVNEMIAFTLMKLRETSPAAASAIFNQAFSEVRTRGDLWEFQRLVPYILPTELDRLVGGRHYLTDSQRMKDANAMIEYAAQLLYRRIQTEPPAKMNPDLVRREYFLWRNLQGVVDDLNPESMWLVNTRLRQLSATLPEATKAQPQGPWSEERLNQLTAAAKSALGEKRDAYLEAAAFQAWRLGQGDLDQAISLAEGIGNREIRDSATGTLYFQAGLKYLRSEGPDYTLNLARKINVPILRTRLYLRILGTLRSVKAMDQAAMVRDELLNWLRNSDKNADTVRATLDYLDSSANENSERHFVALEITVHALNSASLDPPDKPLKQKTYWYPEFHDFRKSLNVVAKADFDRGLELIQILNKKEVAMQVQAAFCSDYLKMQSQSKKPSVKQVPSTKK